MKTFFRLRQLIRATRQIQLEIAEKDRVRDHLVAAMQTQPVHRSIAAPGSGMDVLGSFWLVSRKFSVAIVMMAIILGTAGVTYAAEGALPGDPLYSVKVNVNEAVRAAVTLDQKKKTAWEVRRAERRLEEAEALAAEDRLTSETAATLADDFSAQAERVNAAIVRLDETGETAMAADVSSDFEAALRVHGKVLRRFTDRIGASVSSTDALPTDLRPLLGDIEVNTAMTARIRGNAEAKVRADERKDVIMAARNKMKAAERKITEVTARVEGGAATHTVSTTDVHVGLEQAKQAIVEGRELLDSGETKEAFSLFQKADRLAEEAKILHRARPYVKILEKAEGERMKSENKREKNESVEQGARSTSEKNNKKAREPDSDHEQTPSPQAVLRNSEVYREEHRGEDTEIRVDNVLPTIREQVSGTTQIRVGR